MFSESSRTALRTSNVKNSSVGVALRPVDLKLPEEKIPADLEVFRTTWAPRYDTIEGHLNVNKGRMKYAIGSSSKTEFSYRCEMGLFECVKQAWANHWNLRTSPEDWWFPVACRIAKAIDKAAKSTYSGKKVRNLFVSHQGKQEIKVEIDADNIYQVDYHKLFSSISSEIEARIKVPEFATQMQNDFSTTTPSQKIASQVNLMTSVQEFFDYHMVVAACGIKGLEMLGTQADWDHLVEKLRAVEKLLSPISSEINLGENWFRHVEYVFHNIAQSYSNPESTEVKKFWADVLCVGKDWEYGPSGSKRHEVEAYNGWLIGFLTGRDNLLFKNLSSPRIRQELGGLNSVPMKVTNANSMPVVSDKSELRAGIMGFLLVEPEMTFNHVPALQPNHMWAMMLRPKSPLRDA